MTTISAQCDTNATDSTACGADNAKVNPTLAHENSTKHICDSDLCHDTSNVFSRATNVVAAMVGVVATVLLLALAAIACFRAKKFRHQSQRSET